MTSDLLLALDDRSLAGILTQLPATVAEAMLRDIVPARPGLDPRLAAVVQARLADFSVAGREQVLAADSPWLASLLGRWSLAEAWLTDGAKLPASVGLWSELIEQSGRHAAEALHGRARARRASGDTAGSVSDLVACARRTEDPGLLGKAARLLDRLLARGAELPGKRVRVAIAASSTTELMPALLRLLCARTGLSADIYCGAFGTFRQELLDPQSALHAFKPDFIVIGTNWRDAALTPLDNDAGSATRVVDQLQQLWAAAQRVSPCTIIQHTFDFPAHESAGYLAAHEIGGRTRVLSEANGRLADLRISGVVLVDCARLQAEAGVESWSDDALWHVAKQHPAAGQLPRLLGRYAQLIATRVGLSRKVLVLDLDNTLWSGVVGEDGPHGIKVGPPTAIGEAHAALQHYVLELKRRGVILAVCSKNNEADAREAFRGTMGMVLKEDDFAAFLANWDEKPVNLRRIAQSLNLGTDSLVFLDDNPLERAKVRREMPEVAVVELPEDPANFVRELDQGRYFEALSLSAEDLARHGAYAANLRRESLKFEADNLEDFLRRLDMTMHHGEFGDTVHERVVQLLNKTNQFNLTTRRYGSAEVAALRADPAVWTQYFRLVDCYGDNGLIGLAIARPAETPDIWEIDTMLMSCRVLGRQAEQFMVAQLLAAARKRGITQVRGRYRPTAKNGMVADLFPRLGFTEERREPTGEATYVWDVRGRNFPEVRFVRGRETE